jgi:hypothetical protein
MAKWDEKGAPEFQKGVAPAHGEPDARGFVNTDPVYANRANEVDRPDPDAFRTGDDLIEEARKQLGAGADSAAVQSLAMRLSHGNNEEPDRVELSDEQKEAMKYGLTGDSREAGAAQANFPVHTPSDESLDALSETEQKRRDEKREAVDAEAETVERDDRGVGKPGFTPFADRFGRGGENREDRERKPEGQNGERGARKPPAVKSAGPKVSDNT